MKNRSYNQFCALAFALDAVGERWTLLIIRELLTGPRRFKDLINGLPGISTNLLSDRLKHLERLGILHRRVLPPPAGSTVYELTALGYGLEKSVLELGRWGSRFLPGSLEGLELPSLGSIALAVKAFFHPEKARGVERVYELCLDNEILQVQIIQGEIRVNQGQALKPDVVIRTRMETFVGLFAGQLDPDVALSSGLVQVEGDPDELRHFLEVSGPRAEAA